MAIQFEDILSALCSEVMLSHSNETQKVYLLRDIKEARLARDVLVMYGFDVKVYDEGAASKLYITSSALSPELEQKLAAARAYAISLRQIKQSLDTLCHDPVSQAPDYTIMLANIPPAGKQLVVHFTAPPSAVSGKQAPDAKSMKAKSRPAAVASAKQSVMSGPAVGRASYPGASTKEPKPAGTGQVIYNYISGHMVSAMSVVVTIIVILLVFYTLFIFLKSFLCPDFATEQGKQNHSWYCTK